MNISFCHFNSLTRLVKTKKKIVVKITKLFFAIYGLINEDSGKGPSTKIITITSLNNLLKFQRNFHLLFTWNPLIGYLTL